MGGSHFTARALTSQRGLSRQGGRVRDKQGCDWGCQALGSTPPVRTRLECNTALTQCCCVPAGARRCVCGGGAVDKLTAVWRGQCALARGMGWCKASLEHPMTALRSKGLDLWTTMDRGNESRKDNCHSVQYYIKSICPSGGHNAQWAWPRARRPARRRDTKPRAAARYTYTVNI